MTEETHSRTLAEGLPEEIARCSELAVEYDKLKGGVGAFGAWAIRGCVKEGVDAMGSGDVVRMLRAYEKLRKCE